MSTSARPDRADEVEERFALNPPLLLNQAMDVVEKIRNESGVLAQFDVEHLWLFGSSARGDREPNDIDVLVEFRSPPGLLNYMGLKFKLEEILGKPVDVVSKSACRKRFYRQIEGDLVDVA